ncbi:hypothetical protein LXL04_002045 [Taraxacum kok-saghyz]
MDIPRTRPDICHWSSEMIRVREDYEMMEGGFGLGFVNGVFVEDVVDVSDDDEDEREYEEEVQEDMEMDSDDERSEEAIEKYPDNQSFQIYKSRVSIPEQFEFPIVGDNDEDVAIATPAFEQDAEEESDDDDEDDVNNKDGNDDDDHGDAGIAVGVNDENDENEDEAVNWCQYPIQVKQVESLNMQSPAETEKLEDSVIEEKQVENVVEGHLSIVVAESCSIGGEENMNVIRSISSCGSQEFWSSSAVENLFLAATTEKSKVIERTEQIEEKEVPDDVIDANPVSFVPFHGTEAVVVPFTDVLVDAVLVCVVPSSGTNAGPSEPKAKQKREKKPSMALMSPFKERIVDPRSALTPDENAICEWFFSLRGEPMDGIYNYNGRAVSFRGIFESLFSRTYIHSGVLDAWSDYLNEKEKERDVMNSPFRLFMKRDIRLSLKNERVSEEKKYEIFKENFKAGVYGDKDLLLLKGVDLVFFPVIRSEHIYLFVFNLRKHAYEGLDNSADVAEFLDKYGAVFIPLKMFFLRYLFEIGHQKAFDMSQEELTPRRIKLPWRTIYNKYDCGVFTMRHMKTYFGDSAASKWKPGFTKEGNFQNKLLEKLREKYAATLLLWRMNTKRDEILGHARQYCQTVEPHVR